MWAKLTEAGVPLFLDLGALFMVMHPLHRKVHKDQPITATQIRFFHVSTVPHFYSLPTKSPTNFRKFCNDERCVTVCDLVQAIGRMGMLRRGAGCRCSEYLGS